MRDNARRYTVDLDERWQEVLSTCTPGILAEIEAEFSAHSSSYPETLGTSAGSLISRTLQKGMEKRRYDYAERLWHASLNHAGNSAADQERRASAGRLAQRLTKCGFTLAVLASRQEREKFLAIPLLCKSRWCPSCAAAISLRRSVLLANRAKAIAAKGNLSHIVLTVPNVPADGLRDAFQRLRRAIRDALGNSGGRDRADDQWVRINGLATCCEFSYSPARRDYHPHVHCLADAPFLHQGRLSASWGRVCSKVGFRADSWHVHISQIKANDKDIFKACLEVSKYVCKPAEYDHDSDKDLPEIVHTMKGFRNYSTAGTLRELKDTSDKKSEWAFVGSFGRILQQDDGKDPQLASIRRSILSNPVSRIIGAENYGIESIIPRRHGAEPH